MRFLLISSFKTFHDFVDYLCIRLLFVSNNLFLDLHFTDSDLLPSVSFCLFFFKKIFIEFLLYLGGRIVTEGLKCVCGFNLTLIIWKLFGVQGKKNLEKFSICIIDIFYSSTSYIFSLNVSIYWSDIWRLKFINLNHCIYFLFCSKEDRKIVGNICFHNSSFNSILSLVVFVNSWLVAVVVCLVTRVGLFIVIIIPNWNIKFTKHSTILFLSKSRRFMLKSLICITSFDYIIFR